MQLTKRKLQQRALAALLVISATPLYPASYTWTPGATPTDLFWTDKANWNPNSSFPQLPADIATFNTTVNSTNAYLDNSYIIPISEIQFTGTSAYNLYIGGASQIQLSGPGVANTSTANQNINLNNASLIFQGTADAASGAPTNTTFYNIGTNATVEFDGSSKASSNKAQFVLETGALNLNSTTAFKGFITGNGVVNVTNTVTVSPGGSTSNFFGTMNVLEGTLTDGASNSYSQNASIYVAPGAALNVANTETIASLSGSGTVSVTGTLNVLAQNDTTFSGVLQNGGAINLNGPGIFTLSGNQSTYNGLITVTKGTLQTNAVGALPASSKLSLSDGTTLDILGYNNSLIDIGGGGTIALGEGTLTISNAGSSLGTLTGTIYGEGGGLNLTGGTLTLSGSSSYTGPTTITGATLKGGADSLAPASDVSLYSSVLDVSGVRNTIGSLSGSSDSSVMLGTSGVLFVGNEKNTLFSGNITSTGSSTFVKQGSGLLSLAGANTYTGVTILLEGTLMGNAVGGFSPNSGFELAPNTTLYNDIVNTIAFLKGDGGEVVLGSDLTTGTSGTTTFSGTISGTGALSINGTGTLQLAGTNTYSGGTSIANGTTLQAGAENSFSPNSDVTLNGILDLNNYNNTIGSLAGGTSGFVYLSGTLTLADNSSTDYLGVLTGHLNNGIGGLIKQGSGILTLHNSGGTTYAGPTQIQEGSIQTNAANALSPNSALEISPFASLIMNNNDNHIGPLSGAGTVQLGSGTLFINNNEPTTFAGLITGTGGLTITNTSTFMLSGNNTYSGLTLLNGGGTLSAGQSNAFSPNSSVQLASTLNLNNYDQTIGNLTGTGEVVLGTGVLTYGTNLGGSFTYSGVISGRGGIVKQGSNESILTGVNTFTGGTTIVGGIVAVGAGGNLAPTGNVTLVKSGTMFDISAATTNITIADLAGASGTSVHLGPNTLTAGSANTTTYAGSIDGSGGFTKQGVGALTLSGNLTYTGPTQVLGGDLIFGNGATVSGGDYTVNAGATLDLGNNSITIASLSGDGGLVALGTGTLTLNGTTTSTYDGSITGTGGLTLSGTGLQLNLAGTNTYSGPTTIGDNSTLKAFAENTFSPNSDFTVTGTLDLNYYNNTIGSLAGTGTVTLSGTLTLADNISKSFSGTMSGIGGLIKQGNGSLTLTGSSTYSGVTQIQEGSIIASSLSSASAMDISTAASLQLTSSTSIGPLFGAGTVDLGGSTLSINNSEATTFAGTITGDGGLTLLNTQTFTLSGSSNYKGITNLSVAGSTLAAGATNALSPTSQVSMTNSNLYLNNYDNTIGSLVGSGSVVLGTGTLSLSGGAFSGVISGRGGVNNLGSTLTLTGANTYTGGTNIVGGSVVLSGAGNVAPTGAVAMNPGTTFDISGATNKITIGDLSGGDGSTTVNLGANTLTAGTINSTTFGGVLTGNGGSFVKQGLGDLTVTGNSNYTGPTTVAGGTLRAGGANVFAPASDFTVDTFSTLDLNNNNNSIGSLAGPGGFVTLGTGYLTMTDNNSTSFGGIISGTGGITKQGSGTFTITGPNTYSGLTTISGGTLRAVNGSLSNDSDTLNNSQLEFSQTGFGVNVTYAGSISGSGSVLVDGPGVINWLGNNTYSGGTTVNVGSLVGDTNSLQGFISDNGTVVFNQGFDGTFTGTIVGGVNSNIVKEGRGQLTFVNNMPAFNGTTFINNGILLLNTVLGGNAVVNSGGTLQGTGKINKNLTINHGGTIRPGNSIGTFNVGGNFVQNQGSNYVVQVDNMGHSSLINVSGTATINGGEVFVIPIDGFFDIDKTYVIVNAAGGVTGSYDAAFGADLFSDGKLFIPQLSYTPNQVLLDIKAAIFNNVTKHAQCTNNATQVAKQIDSIAFLPSIPPHLLDILNTFMNTTVSVVCPILNQLTGEQYASNFITSELINRQFVRRLYDPIRCIVTNTCCEPCNCYGFDTWLEGSENQIISTSHGEFYGFRMDGFEVTAGVQKRIGDLLTIGVAASYEYDHVDFYGRGKANTTTYFGGLYGLLRGSKGYIILDGAYGHSDQKMRRPIKFGQFDYVAVGKPNISEFTGYAEMGTDYKICDALFQPFIGMEYDAFTRASFEETGADAFDLSLYSKSFTHLYSRLGFHVTNSICGWDISTDFSWIYRITTKQFDSTQAFLEFGSPFQILGNPIGRDSFEGAVTISKQIGQHFRVYGQAAGEAWSHLATYNFVAGIEGSW